MTDDHDGFLAIRADRYVDALANAPLAFAYAGVVVDGVCSLAGSANCWMRRTA